MVPPLGLEQPSLDVGTHIVPYLQDPVSVLIWTCVQSLLPAASVLAAKYSLLQWVCKQSYTADTLLSCLLALTVKMAMEVLKMAMKLPWSVSIANVLTASLTCREEVAAIRRGRKSGQCQQWQSWNWQCCSHPRSRSTPLCQGVQAECTRSWAPAVLSCIATLYACNKALLSWLQPSALSCAGNDSWK